MIDKDLAELYGVTTKRLNEQVKRNEKRFPADFMFRLTKKEKLEVVAICDHLRSLKFSANSPYAFTEHGAVMLASVLNSERAILVNIHVVRAFIKIRQYLETNNEILEKLDKLEKKEVQQDREIVLILEYIRQLERDKKQKETHSKRKLIGYNR